MTDKTINFLIILFFACVFAYALYLLIKLQRATSEDKIKSIQLKDSEIEKDISNMPLDKLLSEENKRTDDVP